MIYLSFAWRKENIFIPIENSSPFIFEKAIGICISVKWNNTILEKLKTHLRLGFTENIKLNYPNLNELMLWKEHYHFISLYFQSFILLSPTCFQISIKFFLELISTVYFAFIYSKKGKRMSIVCSYVFTKSFYSDFIGSTIFLLGSIEMFKT